MLPTRSVMWYCLHTNKWAYGVLYYIIKSSKHMVHGCAKDCTVDVVPPFPNNRALKLFNGAGTRPASCHTVGPRRLCAMHADSSSRPIPMHPQDKNYRPLNAIT